jgi:hypothetical protein
MDGFYREAKKKDGRKNVCKTCCSSSNKKWRNGSSRSTYLATKRKNRIRDQFNISVEVYDEYLKKPCGICKGVAEVLDHNHSTGEVRAALCNNCNRALGLFNDSKSNLKEGLIYLNKYGSYGDIEK